MNQVEAYLNNYINNFGSKEKVEQYFHKSIPPCANRCAK